jgi:hypothetical protein
MDVGIELAIDLQGPQAWAKLPQLNAGGAALARGAGFEPADSCYSLPLSRKREGSGGQITRTR